MSKSIPQLYGYRELHNEVEYYLILRLSVQWTQKVLVLPKHTKLF